MEKIKLVLVKVWLGFKMAVTSKAAKRFYWNTLNGAIGVAITYFSGINWLYAPVIIGILNGATKEINVYLTK